MTAVLAGHFGDKLAAAATSLGDFLTAITGGGGR